MAVDEIIVEERQGQEQKKLWIETPLKSERVWEELLPELMERVELYGVHDSFELAGPPIVVGEREYFGVHSHRHHLRVISC